MCLKGGVTFDKNEDEKCPAVPPFTLIAITKPQLNEGKKELKEIEEERRNKGVEVNINEPNNQALVVSTLKTRNEREISASPNWVMSPKLKSIRMNKLKVQGNKATIQRF